MAGDAVGATVELLAGLADGRVFGARLPQAQLAHMPRAAVVVRAAGGAGTFGGGYLPTVDDRVDVRAYGETPWEAAQLAAQAARLLHEIRDVQTTQGRVLWCIRGGGPVDVTETQTGWDLVLTSWTVFGEWLEA